ncbi:hypothetical protein AgCh_011816 [Apium graveolens]
MPIFRRFDENSLNSNQTYTTKSFTSKSEPEPTTTMTINDYAFNPSAASGAQAQALNERAVELRAGIHDVLGELMVNRKSNPVPQDPISAIHPPCIYAGDVASAMGFGLCRSKMMNGIVALHSPPMRKDVARVVRRSNQRFSSHKERYVIYNPSVFRMLEGPADPK